MYTCENFHLNLVLMFETVTKLLFLLFFMNSAEGLSIKCVFDSLQELKSINFLFQFVICADKTLVHI